MISTFTIGSSTIGPRLADRVEERLAPGGHERDLLGVHRVALAVVHDARACPAPGSRRSTPRLEHLAHALLHRRNELVGDRAALHLSTNSNPVPRGSGSTCRNTSPNWPAPPVCFLWRLWPSALARDGLAVGDRRRLGVDLELVLRVIFSSMVAQVQLAQAAHDRLVRLRVVLDAQARVLGDELVQDVGDLLLVAALLGLHRQAEHRRRELERRAVHVGILGASRAARASNWISSILAMAQMSPGSASLTSVVVLARSM